MRPDEIPDELVNFGDCPLHYHSADRVRTHDDLVRLQWVERVVSVDAAYAMTGDEDLVLADATGGAFNVTLPPARGGRRYTFVKLAGVAAVTLLPQGTDTVDGGASYVIATNRSPVEFKSVGTDHVRVS